MDYLPKDNRLHRNLKRDSIKQSVVDKASKFPAYKTHKEDLEFLCLICNEVEELVKKKYRIDKKDLVCNICEMLFASTPAEKVQIEKHINYLHDNKMIQKSPFLRKTYRIVKRWFEKKFLD